MQMVIKDNPDFKVYKEFVLQNTTIPVYDAYDLTKVNYGSICTLYFSELNKDSSDFKFGVIIGLESDLEIRWRKEKCFDIIKESSLFDKINKDFPNWLENNPVTGWLVGALEGKGDIEKDFSIVFTLIDRVEGVSYSSLACRWILSTGKKYPSIFPMPCIVHSCSSFDFTQSIGSV